MHKSSGKITRIYVVKSQCSSPWNIDNMNEIIEPISVEIYASGINNSSKVQTKGNSSIMII